MNPPQPLLVLTTGPAGSGKSTLCDRLVNFDPSFSRVVTTTTRPPRPGEIDGIHYHFRTPIQFREKIARGEFLEWARVHGDSDDRLYGTEKSSVLEPLERGQNLVMNIDVQGAEALRLMAFENPILRRSMVRVFIKVDETQMRARMGERITDPAEMERRVRTAQKELRERWRFHYVINSSTRDEDFEELLRIIDRGRAQLCA